MCGPGFEPIFRPRFLDHFYSKSVDRSRVFSRAPTVFLPGAKCRRPQPVNDAPLVGTHPACSKIALSLLLFYLLHATCDVVRGWRSLSEGSATPDRRWMTTECRWASFAQIGIGGPVCDVFRKFSERLFVGQAAWHACKLSTEAAGGGFEDCKRRVVSSTEGSRKLQQSVVAVLTPSTHGSSLGCLLPASWPPAAACLLLAVRAAA